ncbi:MAG: enoyl-CoA hydratase/isomerase family protein [FCB group bacterium]|nr:enoyl-CoA hydratase/isomerase family protein [FCB group bacterium]
MLRLTKQNNIAIIQLNRPKVNAITREMVISLSDTLNSLKEDRETRGVILTGLPGVFSGGLDVIDLYKRDREYMTGFWQDFTTLLYQLFTYPKLLFTAITGHSPAGGTVLAIMTDYRVMGKGEFSIGLNEVAVGLILPNSIGQVYQYLLGYRQAEMLAITGTLVSPSEALRIGLVDELCKPGDELKQTLNRMKEWFKLPSQQQIATKLQLRKKIIDQFIRFQPGDVAKMVEIWFEPSFQQVMGNLVKKLQG